jgi:hypothetical protein
MYYGHHWLPMLYWQCCILVASTQPIQPIPNRKNYIAPVRAFLIAGVLVLRVQSPLAGFASLHTRPFDLPVELLRWPLGPSQIPLTRSLT